MDSSITSGTYGGHRAAVDRDAIGVLVIIEAIVAICGCGIHRGIFTGNGDATAPNAIGDYFTAVDVDGSAWVTYAVVCIEAGGNHRAAVDGNITTIVVGAIDTLIFGTRGSHRAAVDGNDRGVDGPGTADAQAVDAVIPGVIIDRQRFSHIHDSHVRNCGIISFCIDDIVTLELNLKLIKLIPNRSKLSISPVLRSPSLIGEVLQREGGGGRVKGCLACCVSACCYNCSGKIVLVGIGNLYAADMNFVGGLRRKGCDGQHTNQNANQHDKCDQYA